MTEQDKDARGPQPAPPAQSALPDGSADGRGDAAAPGGPLLPEQRPAWPAGAPWGWKQSLIGMILAIGPILVLTLISYALPGNDEGGSSSPATLGVALAAVVLTLVFDAWYLVAAWAVSLRHTGLSLAAWGFRRPASSIFWTVPVALVAVYLISVFYTTLVKPREQAVTQDFPHSGAGVFLFILLACVIAPVFEESFFRGFLFRGFASSWGVIAGAVVSAAVFALSHQQLDIFVPLFALGLALAWVYAMTRSVWGSIALHAVYNLIAVIAWILR